ncbi:MAG: hypothetical protein AAGD32_17870 [Planctomycetota bacterium]
MSSAFKQLDQLLRGEKTRADAVADGKLDLSIAGLLVAVVVLGALFGVSMGTFGVLSGTDGAWLQIISSAIKVPALFLLTLVVTLPSLYVFNALVGSRLSIANMLKLILGAIAVMLAVLAGFATIIAFFSFTTESYPFMKLLNVAIFAVSGVLGLGFLLQTLRRLAKEPEAKPDMPPTFAEGDDPREPGALTRVQRERTSAPVKTIFQIWVVVFALVGAQMSWVMRPFIGDPQVVAERGFEVFRDREGNFFGSVLKAAGKLIGVDESND